MFERKSDSYSGNMKQGRVDVAFEFDVAFDFQHFPCGDAFAARQKMEIERPIFERSEFSGFPIF